MLMRVSVDAPLAAAIHRGAAASGPCLSQTCGRKLTTRPSVRSPTRSPTRLRSHRGTRAPRTRRRPARRLSCTPKLLSSVSWLLLSGGTVVVLLDRHAGEVVTLRARDAARMMGSFSSSISNSAMVAPARIALIEVRHQKLPTHIVYQRRHGAVLQRSQVEVIKGRKERPSAPAVVSPHLDQTEDRNAERDGGCRYRGQG